MDLTIEEEFLLKPITISENLSYINVEDVKILLLQTRTSSARKTGLLNHMNLTKSEGLVFENQKIFHTIGMRFSISIFVFDKNKNLIANPILVEPNRVFVCPNKTQYVVECHESYALRQAEGDFKKSISILNHKASKFVFYFFKMLPFLIFLISSFFVVNSAFANTDLQLSLGNSRTIQLEEAPQTIQVDDPEIIELERIGLTNSIKITPKQIGQTSLTFQYLENPDEILKINVTALRDGVKSLLDDMQPAENNNSPEFENALIKIKQLSFLTHSINAGKIFIFGKIENIEQFQNISKIIAAHPKSFYPSFEIDSKIMKQVINSLNSEIRIMGDHNLNIIQRGEQILLKGTYSSQNEKEKIWIYLSSIMPNLIDLTTTYYGESSVVQINFEFFEVGRGHKKETGLSYPGLGTSGTSATFGGDSGNKPSFQIAPFSTFFRALSARNYVREIAKPVIMTRSGEKASFLAGGEVPIPSVTINGSTSSTSVSFKSVGILFDVIPHVNDDGTIWLKLNAEYSQVNEALSYQNTPGFNSRKISTNIILKEGSAAIISGLIQNTDLKKKEEIPILSKLPIIGDFFQSKKYASNSTELWIAVSAIHKRDL